VPSSGPDQLLPAATDDTTVTAKHVAVQKSVTPAQATPGTALTYSLNFQVSDFGDADSLVVTDTIPDGIDFVSHGSLTVNGSAVPITPTTTINPDFTTTVVYDIGAAAGTLPAGTAVNLGYDATLRQDYQDTGEPILSSDTLTNTVTADYSLVQGASGCSDDSGAAVDIIPVQLDKEIVNLPSFYVPGDSIVFRLTLDVPAGDTSQIRFEDYFPLPVIDIADIDPTFGGSDIDLGPADTLGLTPDSISISPAQNALFIDWPDFSSTSAETIQVEVSAPINDEPFADGLFLTNILLASTANTPGQTTIATGPVSFEVGAPDMVVTKGVSATDGNGTISPAPGNLPVDGDIAGIDAGDTITYTITAENQGSAQAFDITITDLGAAGLTGCSVSSVTDGSGSVLGFTGSIASGILLDDPLAANDGSAGAPYGADTALVTVDCQVAADLAPDSTITNTASLSWASQGGAADFPTRTNDATAESANIGQQKYFIASSEAGTSDAASPPRATVGEVVRYRAAVRIPEGEITQLSVRDNLPSGLTFLDDDTATAAFVSNGGGLSSSTLATIPTINGNAPGPVAVPSTSIAFSIPAGAISGGPFTDGTDPVFAFGDVTNADRDADDEFVLLEFNALVNNTGAGSNDVGDDRSNNFTTLDSGSALNGNSNSVQVRVAEPAVSVVKSATPATGDAGDTISFDITVTAASGANRSPAHDVAITDTLPSGLAGLSGLTITPIGCTSPGIVNTTVGDNLDVFVATMTQGCQIDIAFDATLQTTVAPGTSVTNTAGATWTSLPGTNGTTSNPTGSATPGMSGSDIGERDSSGGINDHAASGSDTVNVESVAVSKAVTATSETETGNNEFRAGIPDLVVGESATFDITVTLPEGTTPEVIITDTVPFSNGLMRVDSASVESVGGNLTPTVPSPVPAISDTQMGDSIADTVNFDFGQVDNTPDNAVTAADRIVVRVNATLVDESANANGDELTNNVLVQFGPGLDASASAGVDVVEPVLTVDKSGSITQGDAGDSVTYTVTLEHTGGSSADAQDLVFDDPLPADLTLNLASIAVTSGPDFDVNTSTGNTVSLGWTDLLRGEVVVLEYEATLDPTVQPSETLTNTADLSWDSIASANPDQRSNNGSDSHAILITQPGLAKVVFVTSEGSTGSGQFGSPADLTIGEQVTYRFTTTFAEGTSDAVVVTDQLPTGSSMLAVESSQVVSVGGNLSGASLPAAGDPGTPSDTNADTIDDRLEWSFGTIQNSPDGTLDANDDITFEVIARVLDVAANQSGDVDQLNTATFTTATSSASGTVGVDIVAPEVDLDKSIVTPADGFVDAGDTVTVRLDIAHTTNSTADAFNLAISDSLPAGLTWGGDGTVAGDCPGLVTDSSAQPLIAFDIATLDLATDTCFITYEVTVDNTVMPGESLQNSAVMEYDSQPVFIGGQTRRQMAADTAEVTVLAPTLVKVDVDSSLDDTGMTAGDPTLRDLTIGETVTYELTLVFPEGVTGNAVLVDSLPDVMEAIGAVVTATGNNVSTTLPGTPVFEDLQNSDGIDDTVTFDFGDVTNTPDGIDDANDRLTVQIVARIVDVPANVGGNVLVNNAQFTHDGGSLSDDADIEIVEPQTDLTKSMGPVTDGTVRISLTIDNTGTAPAYDLSVEDVFDEADWNLGGFSPVSVPAGFTLNLQAGTPGPDQQTLVFATDPGAVSPAGTVPAGSSVSAVFDVPLAVLPPGPNPLPNTADQVAGDTLPGENPTERDLPTDSDTDQIGVPDLELIKTVALETDADGSGDVSPGDTLRYTLTLYNNGEAVATGIVVDDSPDANSTLVVGSVITSSGSVNIGNGSGDATVQVAIPSLAAGDSAIIEYDTVVVSPLPAGIEELVNQAAFDASELLPGVSDDPDPPNPDDPTVVPVVAAPDLSVTKDDGVASTNPGSTIAYTLDYANDGNQDATGVTLTETVPAATTFDALASDPAWNCTAATPGSSCTLDIGALGAGDSGSVVFAVVVDTPLASGVDQLDNTVTIVDDGGNGPDPTPLDNSDSHITPLDAGSDLAIVKSDGGVSAEPGDIATYTLDYENKGNQVATGVVINDVVPANTVFVPASSTGGWSCTPDNGSGSNCSLSIGTLDPGETGSAAFAVRVNDPLPLDAAGVDNTANISDDGANGPDPTPDDNSSTDTTPLIVTPALAIDKQLRSAPDPIAVDSVLEYMVTATNTGNVTLTNVQVSDNLITPTGGSTPCAVVPPGATCTLVGEYVIAQPDVDAGGVDNTATATSDQVGPIEDSLSVPVARSPAVDLVKNGTLQDANGNQLADAGETIDYTVTVTNTGNVTLTNVDVTDPLVPLSCSPAPVVATLPVGAAIDCTGSLVVNQSTIDAGGSIDNTASTTGQDPEGNPVADGDEHSVGVCSTTTGQVVGLLWNDLDRDGATDTGEAGLPALLTIGAPGAAPADLTVVSANADGNYLFPDLPEGSYELRVLESYLGNNFDLYAIDPPLRSIDIVRCGTTTEDFNFAAPADGVIGDFVWFDVTENGAVDEFLDANDDGLLTETPVGTPVDAEDFEWIDLNQNGQPDDGEFSRCGLEGVTVELLDGVGNVVDTRMTNLRGEYFFRDLPLGGSYTTRVDATDPANFGSAQTVGAGGLCAPLIGTRRAGPSNARGSAQVGCGSTTPLSATSATLSASASVDDRLDYGLVCGIAGRLGLDKALTANQDQDGSGTISLGDTLEYTVTATNTGSVTLSNVVVSDNLITPTSTTCATLPQGEACVLVGTYTVTQVDVDAGELVNTATTGSDQTTERTTVVDTPVPQNPSIDLDKTSQLDDANGNRFGDAGEFIDYQLTVTNTGDVTLGNVEIVDDLIQLDCVPKPPTGLAPGETIDCSGRYEVTWSDIGSGAIVNVATASGNTPDDTPIDDTDSTETPVLDPLPVPTGSRAALLILMLALVMLGMRAAARRGGLR
jgi:uncharacterized repeat protein (TIGR01451 family)/fimbrial isopeptide formation D2 family protein